MKVRLQKLKTQHWDVRPLQERKWISIGALIVVPVLAYILLWQPSHEAVGKLHAQLPLLRMQAEQIKKAQTQVEELRHLPKPAVMDAMAVKVVVEQSASAYQLGEMLTDAQEPNGVRIVLPAVSFENWVRWLRDLQQSQHIRADTVAITRLSEPGMVSIRATLTNGNVL